MKSAIVLGMTGLGLLMLVLSGVWVSMFSGTGGWTNEKAKHWSDVKDRMNNLSPIVNAPSGKQPPRGVDPAKAKAEFDELKKENEQLAAEFTGNYNSPRTTATVLKWGGISLVAVGLIGWYVVKNASS